MSEELIARLEKLTGPDRELFIEVATACFGEPRTAKEIRRWDRYRRFLEAEAWTDAAMMLVPEVEKNWHVDKCNTKFNARLSGDYYEGATPAIALLIAIFKARASLSSTSGDEK